MEKIEEEDRKEGEKEQSTFYSSISTASATVLCKVEMREMNM